MSFLNCLLRNKHYPTGAVLAKQGTNWATALWSLLVLLNPDAHAITGYNNVTRHWNEGLIAVALLAVSVSEIIWIWANWRPRWFVTLGYAFLWTWWLGATALVVQARPVQVTAIMGVATVATLAAFAFASGRRSTGDRDARPA